MVEVKYVRHMARLLPLQELKKIDELQDMQLFVRKQLSVQKVSRAHWNLILELEGRETSDFGDKQDHKRDSLPKIESKPTNSSNEANQAYHNETISANTVARDAKSIEDEIRKEIIYTHGG